jgi:hypothetical protein
MVTPYYGDAILAQKIYVQPAIPGQPVPHAALKKRACSGGIMRQAHLLIRNRYKGCLWETAICLKIQGFPAAIRVVLGGIRGDI